MKKVLLVEDSDNDAFLMKMACQRTGIPHLLHALTDGEQAIQYLAGEGAFADRTTHPFPDLVFLDLNLPKCDGLQVLEWIRSHPEMKSLPVVILTGSTQMADVNRAYELGVTSYLRKVACPAEFGQAVRVILKYWLELNVPNAG